MNDIFGEDMETEEVSKKNWASVAQALDTNRDEMNEIKTQMTGLANQLNAMHQKFIQMERTTNQRIAAMFDGGPTAE